MSGVVCTKRSFLTSTKEQLVLGLELTDVFLLLTVVECGTLNATTNGQVNHTAGTTFGHTATYSCDTGYTLEGSSTRTCQTDGMWSGSEPTCQGVLLLSTPECTKNLGHDFTLHPKLLGRRTSTSYFAMNNYLYPCIHIYYLMGEKVIWLDIARVCGRIFTSRRRVKIQHKSAIPSHITFSHIK